MEFQSICHILFYHGFVQEAKDVKEKKRIYEKWDCAFKKPSKTSQKF